MTIPTGRPRNRVISTGTTRTKAGDRQAGIKPNKQTIGVRPHKYVNPTKSEMYEDLRKAVENTK